MTDDNTVIGHLNAAAALIDQHKGPDRSNFAREFALAQTAIEDAQMRFTRGYAMKCGVFNPAHLELQMGVSDQRQVADNQEINGNELMIEDES